ncbi:alpha-amylase family glycosyl hydrolase [Algoriphagus sp. CAU 1675]|uniref:alpha-amylase family glycosyl hydrolase n=1 Tax=Algoriphagus sp. CAU 1675 TaxID=3032597 RepID=UPI0023DAFDB3|nr:alpha-amylase family glycosyl hydrolase [Algoriphagus sp. CAU 1675]MDF2158099.1 alpha-amylase family glycosyl hydrolase [Algoriphagus sp. CAU 1675]
MKKTILSTSLLAVFAISSCKTNESPELKNYWPKAGVTYEIFVQSFYDSDGDGIGDFNGVTQNLDYIKELGANAIWLMPIMPSPTYHKYDVTDYKAVHPDYGTMEDFKTLLKEAHQRDIKIVIDMIINHTSNQHPWFLASKEGRDNPYRDYYVWAQKDTIADYLNKKVVTLDSDNIQQWHDPGMGEDYYYGFFWGGMPDLNFDNPKVREEIYEIGRFWLEEVGVDGFRLDAAKHIFPDDRPLDNHAFWKEFRAEMEKIKPDVYLVGEVYDKKEIVAPYLPGLPALFNFDFHYTLLDAFKTEDGMLLAKKQKEIIDFYEGITSDFIDATISSNHDQPRLLNELGSDPQKQKQAIAIMMTMPGAPYIYYGEEIGMKGLKPDEYIREPFLWDVKEKDQGRATWIEPRYSTDKEVVPLAIQKKDPKSFFNHYKTLIHLRSMYPALALGSLELPDSQFPEPVMAYFRTFRNQEIFVVHNMGSEEVEIQIPEGFDKVIFGLGDGVNVSGKLSLKPNSSRVYLKD